MRKLHHLALDSSYRNLGRLRLEQGDVRSASVLLDRAVELASPPHGQIPSWDPFEALEENRSSSLRMLGAARKPNLSPGYWEALLRLQRAEVQALLSGSDQAEAAAARADLARREVSLTPGAAPISGDLLECAQSTLDLDTALFSFHLGETVSWMWAVERRGMELYPLPPREPIAAQVKAAVKAIREDRAPSDDASSALRQMLFGKLAARFDRKQHWLIALDDALFEAPISALVARTGPHPARLVELHSAQVIPGVGWWLDAAARQRAPLSPLFVGIGDPVYNSADSRLQVPSPNRFPLFASPLQLRASDLALPRLMASGPELDACARAWNGENALLKGPAASARLLQWQLQRNPSVVHFATRVLESADRPSDGQIARSLTEKGEVQLLRPAEIAHWKIRSGLVVLSGCLSAAGEVLPGTGVLGLTRAWLAAGADDAIGSRWATTDDTGVLFSAFYRNLRAQARPNPAEALRAAQLEMMHSGDWRSHPRYWAAYFTVGIEGMR